MFKPTATEAWIMEWLRPETLKFWEDNPRINSRAAQKLALTIARHGFRSPIVVWKKNMTVYKGNTTLKAALLLLKGIEVDGKKVTLYDVTVDGRVPVALHNFPSEVAAKAYGIDDNRAGENSDWDDDVLRELMSVKDIKRDVVSFTVKEKELIMLATDHEKIDKIKETSADVKQVFTKLKCSKSDREELKELLTEFVKHLDFEVKVC